MSDDTREGFVTAPVGSQLSPQKGHDESQGKSGNGVVRPSSSPNVMPGGTEHTAGGQAKPVRAVDAAKSIKLEDFKEIHKKPCVRDAFLTGIPSGAAAGVVSAVLGGASPA